MYTPTKKKPQKSQKKGKSTSFNPEEFFPLPEEIHPRLNHLKELCGLETFPFEYLHARRSTSKDGFPQKIYFLTPTVKQIMNPINSPLKVLNTGIKVFHKMGIGSEYRLAQEGLPVLLPFITKRIVPIDRSDLIVLLSEKEPFQHLTENTQNILKNMESGSLIFSMKDELCNIHCVGICGKKSLSVLLKEFEKKHILHVLCPELVKEKEKTTKQKEDTQPKLEGKDSLSESNDKKE